ncbi:MAG: glutamine--fructose-6-phosphate transaminase (isomerizing) [Candidatus Spechtbacterales bacterium]
MCGIIGYIGKRRSLSDGVEALKQLEYRGYDSAGCSYVDASAQGVSRFREAGRVATLEAKLPKNIEVTSFIFHTRWATHGAPTRENAHPHSDCKGEFYVAHNGIIENYDELTKWLKKHGHTFSSQTDTEVLPHLIEHFYKGDLLEAVQKALRKVVGTYGIVVLSSRHEGELVAARLGSPLLVGIAKNGYFVASDPAGVLAHTKKVVYLNDGELVLLTPDKMRVVTLDNKRKKARVEELEWELEQAQKEGYAHFMLKEIMEQPRSLKNTIRGRLLPKEGNVRLGGLDPVRERLRSIERIHIVACGTASYAGLVGAYMLEEYAGIPTQVTIGSEFRYKKPLLDEKTAVLVISQSGETADTLAAVREAKNKGAVTLGIVNVVGSTVAREVDAGIYNHAGPEIGVASTKAFTSQLAVLILLTVFLGRQRDMSLTMGARIIKELAAIPALMEKILDEQRVGIAKIARKYKNSSHMMFLGRKYNYPMALEGALKLKEISYIHAEGYPGGELKHGPIALIDENLPTFAIMPKDSVYEKMVSNSEEVKARKGPLVLLTTEGNRAAKSLSKDVVAIPKTLELLTPLLVALPLQLFAYYVGVARGLDVDKPRNLAKSVTVE